MHIFYFNPFPRITNSWERISNSRERITNSFPRITNSRVRVRVPTSSVKYSTSVYIGILGIEKLWKVMELLIESYFYLGVTYREIVTAMKLRDSVSLSERHLKRLLRSY